MTRGTDGACGRLTCGIWIGCPVLASRPRKPPLPLPLLIGRSRFGVRTRSSCYAALAPASLTAAPPVRSPLGCQQRDAEAGTARQPGARPIAGIAVGARALVQDGEHTGPSGGVAPHQ